MSLQPVLDNSNNNGNILIRNAKLFDGTSNDIKDGVSILVQNGTIKKIDTNIIGEENVSQLDVNGAYVLPGLIDSHVHMNLETGVLLHHFDAPSKKNWKKGWGRYLPDHLKSYLACGVTTILDVGAFDFVVKEIREYLSNVNPGPRFLTLGPFLSPPNGYCSFMNYTASTISEVEKQLDLINEINPVGLKIPIERGFNPIFSYQKYSAKLLTAIKKGANKRKLPIYVHATCEQDQTTAVKLGIHALAHTLLGRNIRLSDKFVELMRQTDTYQMTTMSTMDSELTYYYPERLNDPLLQLVVPKIAQGTAKNQQKKALAYAMQFAYGLSSPPGPSDKFFKLFTKFPRTFSLLFGTIIKIASGKRGLINSLEKSKDAILRLHKAGVPIVMGSDSVPTFSALYAFHGINSIREIELIGEAGLSPIEAIKASTITPAKMLNLDHEIGTIEVGKKADMIVLRENPLENLAALRSIQWTIKDGMAHTPDEWMKL